MAWYPCPKCETELDSDYEPVDYDFFDSGYVATEASCPSCGWRGQLTFSVDFKNYWDAETGETIDG